MPSEVVAICLTLVYETILMALRAMPTIFIIDGVLVDVDPVVVP